REAILLGEGVARGDQARAPDRAVPDGRDDQLAVLDLDRIGVRVVELVVVRVDRAATGIAPAPAVDPARAVELVAVELVVEDELAISPDSRSRFRFWMFGYLRLFTLPWVGGSVRSFFLFRCLRLRAGFLGLLRWLGQGVGVLQDAPVQRSGRLVPVDALLQVQQGRGEVVALGHLLERQQGVLGAVSELTAGVRIPTRSDRVQRHLELLHVVAFVALLDDPEGDRERADDVRFGVVP